MVRLPTRYPRQAELRSAAPTLDGGIPIAKLIAPLLQSIKLDAQVRMSGLGERWVEAVGQGIAAHTRPGRLLNQELTIYVDSSPWLSELKRYAQRELLANLQKTFGKDTIASLRLQLDPGH
jgi:predicted nucleic acid-binding Zn ribbon protein